MEYYSSIWMPTDSLAHHGIKGMKWGVRRYQNADGTLTSAGRKRYGSDLDLTDKSKTNIARVRLGESRRRLDYAKANNPSNYTRIALLKQRERMAKRAVKQGKRVDRGAKKVAKGETITGNVVKASIALGASVIGKNLWENYMASRITSLNDSGKLTAGHAAVASALLIGGNMAISSAGLGYAYKKSRDNVDIRRYYRSASTGQASTTAIGGPEYKDVVERRKRGE